MSRLLLKPLLLLALAGVLLRLDAAIIAAERTGNRLAYLDERNPYYPHPHFARLTTPMWVGEEGVDAVILLSVDDMGGPPFQPRYDVSPEAFERFLLPLIERLEQIDGRAPIAVMTCQTPPNSPAVARLLERGLSFDCHTFTHRFPFFKSDDSGDPAQALRLARLDYLACMENLFDVPGNRAVAHRMPGCDAQNTLSPRFFAEVFPLRTSGGDFLTCDTSITTWFPSTGENERLPRDWRYDSAGRERFGKYPHRIPQTKNFVNYITDYPFPYPINQRIWELPVTLPCDSHGVHQNRPKSPHTVEDWKRAVDICVRKQGLFNLLFHTIGYIENAQVLEVIDYADRTYGRRVKFLNCREIYDRLTKNVLGGIPLRSATGDDNGVRLLDVNADGYLDAVIGNSRVKETRIWQPDSNTWRIMPFPVEIVVTDNETNQVLPAGVRFGTASDAGRAGFAVANERLRESWWFDGRWKQSPLPLPEKIDGQPFLTQQGGEDRGARFRDVSGDGISDLIVNNESQNAVFLRDIEETSWQRAPFELPEKSCLVDANGADQGLRFVDLDGDGDDDLVFSNDHEYWVRLFVDASSGWSKEVSRGEAGSGGALPPIVRDGTLNGVWFQDGAMVVENEFTVQNKDFIERIPFETILGSQPE